MIIGSDEEDNQDRGQRDPDLQRLQDFGESASSRDK